MTIQLHRFFEEDELSDFEKQAIHKKIEEAFGELERGEDLSEEESRARLEEHKAAWLAANRRG
jgi:hypothetical protein